MFLVLSPIFRWEANARFAAPADTHVKVRGLGQFSPNKYVKIPDFKASTGAV